MNNTRRPMSALGRSLFEMMNDMNKIYAEGLRHTEKPVVTQPIKRPSQKEALK